jgi:glycosyltransferase involved in cell wall biosynthesis
MKVLLAHNRYRVAGGEERHVELLERGLREAEVDVRIFERRSDEIRTPLRRLATAVTMSYSPLAAAALGRELRDFRPDVVHFHNLLPLLTPSSLRAAHASGARVVLTVHNYRFACPAGTLLRRGCYHEDCVDGSSLACAARNARGSIGESLAYGIALELQRRFRLLERWVDAFIAPSAFVAERLERAGLPSNRIHVLPSGVELEADPAHEGTFALFAGRLSPEKGVHALLRAARRTQMPVLVAGGGPLAAEVAAAPHVRYLGELDRLQLTALRRRAAFAVVPSLAPEVFPMTALEAFAAGKPVVASRVGGLPELVEDGVTGTLVPPDDPARLAEAMTALWEAPERAARFGERAWRRVRDRYSLREQIARTITLYARAA